MNKKLFSIALVCLITLLLIPYFVYAQEKITGPWLWMIAPTEPGQGGAESIDIDSLAVASGGGITESDIATNGANEGDRVGNYVWTPGQISTTIDNDNINACLNQIGLTNGNVDHHSSYALFTFNSDTDQNEITMHVGSDDAIKVWLNGEVVHTNPVNRGSSGFQDMFPINLVTGDNLLMVKVSERTGGWSMFVGIDTANTDVGINTVSGVSSEDGQIQTPDMLRPIVHVFYLPTSDSPPRSNVDAEIDVLIKKVQRFFANEMERHGFERKTFQIEVDENGNTVIHRGKFDGFPDKNFYVYMQEGNVTAGVCGRGGYSNTIGNAGMAINYCWNWGVVAHELGHAFGLPHDFRPGSDIYIMSYGTFSYQLSDGAAGWLDAHRAFNPGKSAANERTKIEMLPPSLAAPPNAIRTRFKVSDPDGLHQAQLHTPTGNLHPITSGFPELLNYKELNGSTNTTVEFVTDLLTPNSKSVSLHVIDEHGNFTVKHFNLNVTTLLPQDKVVSIPDANLTAAVKHTLRLSSSQIITTNTMLNLQRLHVPNSGITDLTGLENAHNLINLYLTNNKVSDISALTTLKNLGSLHLNNTNISDISVRSVLLGLTNLNTLWISNNIISDISALTTLKNLTWLELNNTNISDIAPLSGLMNLNILYLNNNHISDIAPLSTLKNLTWLHLNNNNISDISALSELTNLTLLYLNSANISDVSPLSELTQLTNLGLAGNNISDISPLLTLNLTGTQWDNKGLILLGGNPLNWTSINTHIPAMQAKGIEVQYDQRTPTKILKISGDTQQAIINSELPFPFVVEIRDQNNRAYAEVPVTFSITKGNGKLNTPTTATDVKGRAKIRFTLGETEGETTIHATAPNISQPIQFTATAILPTAIVQLPDTNLTAKITKTLGKTTDKPITVNDMLTLTSLNANNINIRDLTGLQHASNLTTLMLDGNNLSNIEQLKGLTQLTTLSLNNNNISDITALVELTQLESLSLENNKLSDITPLTELTALKTLRIRGNLLSYPSLYTTIPSLRSRSIDVLVDTRTPTTLINIPGTTGVAGGARQIVVHVQDQNGDAFSGVPVNFTLTATRGHRFTAKAITNSNGKANTMLTLGPEPGENTVSTTVSEIPKPLTFTVTTIDVNTPVHIPDVNLHAKIAETLNKPKNAKLTAGDLLELTGLDAPNANIQDLTGLEYAHNLRSLDLRAEYTSGEESVNSNTVSDLSPLIELTRLTHLNLSHTKLIDLAPLSGLTNITSLYLWENNISDLAPLSELKNLTQLSLWENNISDLAPLSKLKNLITLNLDFNNISDLAPLSELTQLTQLRIHSNNISDLAPLLTLNLTGTQWDSTGLNLWNNPLSYTSINTHIPVMQAKGTVINYHNRTPTKLLKISGDTQQTIINSELRLPFVVEVQDQNNRAYAEVPVTFSITKGNGKLSTLTAKTDVKGRAKIRFTLGETEGETTIHATAPNISQPIQFTATAILPTAIVQLPDTNLTAKITKTLGKTTDESITVVDMLTLTSLNANNINIRDLTGLQHASNLTTLMLDGNNLSNIEPLTGLKQLTTLSLNNNNISDITALVELTQLESLSLENNKLSDITPLTELTALKTLRIRGNLLSYPSLYTTIPSLRSHSVDVLVDTRTPTTLINTPGTPSVADRARQIVVHVQDQNGDAFSGVLVNFTLTAAEGHRFTAKAITTPNGKATTTLTLGPEPGENTVSATVSEIPKPLTFTVTTIDVNTPIHIPDVNLHAKIAETLNKPKNAKLTAGDLWDLTGLDAPNANIQDLTGIENAFNLSWLYLHDNNDISDISALSGLIRLNTLTLGWNSLSDISALSRLTNLNSLWLRWNNISDISALSGLANLNTLLLDGNNISDISALTTLTNLETLQLHNNNISDISALSALTNLNRLWLHNNNISDLAPLLTLNLTGTQWDSTGLNLWNNPLSYTSINTHIPAMQAKGIEVQYDQRTPTKILKISGDTQQAITNSELPSPFVVEIRDQNNRAYAEVPVTFSITKGNGKLNTLTTATDVKGRAKIRFTLGETEGETTIHATAPNISQPIQFTATAILPTAIVQLPDTNLTAKITKTLGKTTDKPITVNDMLTLTSLNANNINIRDLTGLQHASNLTTLMLDGNNLSNIEQLKGLTQLTTLSLNNNNISDITALVELTQLESLSLENNKLSDITPLTELTALKTLRIRGNLLSYPSLYTTIPSLRSHSVDVLVDTRMPTTLINIPGTPSVAGGARQVVVHVQDQNGNAFSGVPVNFTLTAAEGHRFTAKAITTPNGKATTTLTLGPEPGENTVSATVSEIPKPLTFTVTTIDVNTPIHIPDVNLHAKIAETLNKPKNAKLTAGDLWDLTGLDAPNANIQDLTGLQYAHNLRSLDLSAEYISGEGSVNSNTVSDLSPLIELTRLTHLNLSHTKLIDLAPLSGLTNITSLYLWGNNISDLAPLSELKNLTQLSLWGNNISDLAPLSELKNLNTLNLDFNNISDLAPLSELTQLTQLRIHSNNISDLAPLLRLNLIGTQWDNTGLYLWNNPLSWASINTHIPAMQAKGIVIAFHNITHPEFLIISGDGQENLVGQTLPSPFVVEYRDANGKPKEGVKVTFSITEGDAKLTDTNVTTNAVGRAQTFLISGWKLGIITVLANAEGINTHRTFTVQVVLPENHVPEDVNADGVVDVDDLVLVAGTIDTTPSEGVYPNPDVNGDGVVDDDDLTLVREALENIPTAPAIVATTENNLQRWIDEAKQRTNKDANFLRGIEVLEKLLASLLPEKTALLANYPNPFNPETWIPYHLAKSAEVTIHIYAVNGTLIRTLALGHKPPGTYQHRNRAAHWDGRNAQGERIASGIYFYTLTASDFTSTRKMLIRK